MIKALVLMAEGFEEIELSSIVDILRRGGITVTTAGLKGGIITGSRGIKIQPDSSLDSIKELYDIVILPGGSPGYINLGRNKRVLDLVNKYHNEGKIVAAICGAPSVLAKCGLLSGRKATIYKGMENELKGAEYVVEQVVEDGNIITSQGPGTAIRFALTILKRLTDEEKAGEIQDQLMFR
ncbi:DJ-1 family protein [Candidatus Methanoperedens nitroreducens]|uniref:DJ-1 family protein n=1 Tax=Candidatus Methanoperedens nitratireducens TaxID=1392998 RepID=A0A062V135_9EURY|nr:DJ-1 family glyoxalase III [Candidatus Methanoperedens nitroreducens]KCZ72841.1 DJ-1 family protein [Candidatus Methanoperedens nitroreducens]MDJ1423228.1 DJ-1/PfpI family protein [Candidatus Methanoperedens sp.]